VEGCFVIVLEKSSTDRPSVAFSATLPGIFRIVMIRGIVVRIIVAIAVPIAFLSPFNGILWYLWYSHGRPNDFIWPQYAFNSGALLLAIATLAGYVLFEMPYSPLRFRGLIVVTIFWLWIGLSTAAATDRVLALPKFLQYTNILIITYLVAAMANSASRIRAVLMVIAVAIGFLGSKCAFDFLVTGAQFRAQGVGGLMKEQNEFALCLNMAIVLLIGLSNMQESFWRRWGLRAAAAGCTVSVVGTYSRSGLLGLGLATFLLTWYSKKRMLGFGAMALALVALVAFGPQKALDRYKTISTAFEAAFEKASTGKVTEDVDPSALGRLQAWEAGTRMMKAHPILGVGPLNFLPQFQRYFPGYHARVAHNAFVALGAESGIPATLLFALFIALAIADMWWTRRKMRNIPELAELAAQCLIIQMTLTVYVVPNFFINRQNLDLMYHLIGLSVGLSAFAKLRIAKVTPQKENLQGGLLLIREPVSV
jgi:putative inorganic carbon (HCO3(-)) transporter